jgi:hypothetical protein
MREARETSMPKGTPLVVAHDAGGAQILSSWQRRSQVSALHVLDGPAKSIFAQKSVEVNPVPLDQGVQRADWILTGTSWASLVEKRALRAANRHQKFSVAFLDHWVNYKERFTIDGRLELPTEIWVGDTHAQAIAQSTFPSMPIQLQHNPYFEDLQEFFRSQQELRPSRPSGHRALFIGENISEAGLAMYGDANYLGYTEIDALNYFLENLSKVRPSINEVLIRCHPTESPSKYEFAVRRYPHLISVSTVDEPLEVQVADSDVIVGANSVGLVLGVLAGKPTISVIPPGGAARDLPFAEIVDLRDLIDTNI